MSTPFDPQDQPDPAAQSPNPNPYQQPAQPKPPFTEAEDTQWASLAHFGGAVVVLAFAWNWLALLAIAPALVIYLVHRTRGPRTLVESREALNFVITGAAAIIAWGILSSVIDVVFRIFAQLTGLWFLSAGVWWLLSLVSWALIVAIIVFSIVGGVKVNGGGSYRYPFALRLVK